MAKFNVSGKSIEDILSLDVTTLDEKELRQVTSRLISASNKRIRRGIASETQRLSPSIQKYASGEKQQFTLKGTKNIKEVRKVYLQAKQFLNYKTSTSKGFKSVREETLTRLLGEDNIEELTKAQEKRIWEIYDKMKALYGESALKTIYGSNQLQQLIAESVVDNPKSNSDTLLQEVEEEFKRQYERQIQEEEKLLESVNDDIDLSWLD